MYLSFLSEINLTDLDITVTDTTDTGAVPYYYSLIGAVRVEGPTGLVYNGNLGAPEFTYPGPTPFNYVLPSVAGALPMGTYKVKVTGRFTKRAGLTNVDLGTNKISIPAGITDIAAGEQVVLTGGSNDGTYDVVVVGASAYGVDLTLSQALASATVDGECEWTQDEELQETYDLNVTASIVKTKQTYDCAAHAFLSEDQTNYNLLYTNSATGASQNIAPTGGADSGRIHTLHFPDGPGNVPVDVAQVTNLYQNVTTTLWTKTFTTNIETTLSYTLPSGLIVTLTMEGEDDEEVICDNNLCCIKACIHTLYDRYHDACGVNEIEAERLNQYIADLAGAYVSYRAALDCGDNANVQKYYAIMKSIVSATDCPCGCSDDEDDSLPVEIVGLFPIALNGNAIVVQSGDLYIVVVANVVGSTTTYTLTLATTQIETLIATYINANPALITAIVDIMELGCSISTFVTVYDTAISFTGDTTVGTNTVLSVIYGAGITSANLKKGDPINMTDFPAGTYITSIGVGTITVSNVATASTVGQAGLIKALTSGLSVQKYKRSVSGLTSYHYVIKLTDLVNIFFESAGGACGADVNTDFTLATVATGGGGNYSLQLHGQLNTTTPGDEPNAISISILKNGVIINPRAKLDITPHMGNDTLMTTVNFSLVTYEALAAADVIKLRINPSNGGVTLTNLSALFVKIGGY